VKKISVTVPQPKTEDRLLSEVAADLVVGFFRLVGAKVVAARDLIVVGGRFVWRWLTVGGKAVATGYRLYAPARVQSILGGLVKFVRYLIVGYLVLMLKLARLLRLDRLGKRLFVGYDRLRNRLSVTSA